MSFGPTRQRRINLFVGASRQILDIQQYASGLKLGPAAILNQNPIFEIGSIAGIWMGRVRLYFRLDPIIGKIRACVNYKATPHCGRIRFLPEPKIQPSNHFPERAVTARPLNLTQWVEVLL
jgi:hypothetical protein